MALTTCFKQDSSSTHLLGRVNRGAEICLQFFLQGGATLVVLGEDLDTGQILTTDNRDFSVYRRHGTKPFHGRPQQ